MKRNENKIQKVEDSHEMSKNVQNAKNVKLLKVATFGSSEKMTDLPKRGRGRPRKDVVETVETNNLVTNEPSIKRGRGRPKKIQDVTKDFAKYKSLINYINLKSVEGYINLQTHGIGVMPKHEPVPFTVSNNPTMDLLLYQEPVLYLIIYKEDIKSLIIYKDEIKSLKIYKDEIRLNSAPDLDPDLDPGPDSYSDSDSDLDIISTPSPSSSSSSSSSDLMLYTKDKRLKSYISEEDRFYLNNDILFKRSKENGLSVLFQNRSNLKMLIKNVELFLEDIDSYKSKGYINKNSITLLDDMKLTLDYGLVTDNEGYIFTLVPDPEFYRWFLNLIILTLYYNLLQIQIENEADDTDNYHDLNMLIKNLYGRLHPLILTKIQKKGISVSLNLYNGFDTEFEIEDESKFKNKLLSRQIAINSRMIIKLPLFEQFYLGYIHPLTSEIKTKEDMSTGGLLNIIKDIRICIKNIRVLKYNDYDKFLESLKNVLDSMDIYKKIESHTNITYIFNFTKVKTSITYPEEYSFKDLVKDSKNLGNEFLEEWILEIFKILEETGIIVSDKDEKTLNVLGKSKCRWTVPIFKDKIVFSLSKILYVCCHFTNADLTMLNDFDELKHYLNIVHKNFVTLGKGLQIEDITTYIRDTSLLAPMGRKSLEKVGDIYGTDFQKIKIPNDYKRKMGKLLLDDKELFDKYAIQDSVITLKHANSMEDFNISLNKTGVPLTLSSLGKIYVLNNWKDYTYQKSPKFLIGDTHNLNTPQGIELWQNAGLFLSYFIGNYKGGRNESYMYGYDKETTWFDYDLNGAYTTVLAYLGNPNYNKCRLISDKVIKTYKDIDFFTNYIIMKVRFKFPPNVKYPSIPCYLDQSTTVYPLEGEGLITGPEYILARNQGCSLKILHGVCIPFYVSRKGNCEREPIYYAPYYDIIQKIQALRRKYVKGTLQNYLYKEIGNSIYGNIVRGISTKKLYDVKTNSMKNLTANELSNPILGSYTTAIVRSVIGESLHLTHELGGKIVSVTTDGFITDIADLELKMMELPKEKRPLLELFRKIRSKLSDSSEAYELKNSGSGIISWCTRGQLGINSKIKATTGFQTKGYNKKYLSGKFIEIMSGNKEFEFIQQSLRGGNEIYKQGGQVVMQYKERSFKFFYDNRRVVLENATPETLLDSEPLTSVSQGKEYRELIKITDEKVYNKVLTKRGNKTYKNVLESAVRTFIKGLLQEKPLFGLENYKDNFKTYKDIITFVKDCGITSMRLTTSSISHLKNRKIDIKLVDRTEEIETFVKNLKIKLPLFREDEFYKSKTDDLQKDDDDDDYVL